MLRAHYRETLNLQTGRSKKAKEKWKRMKGRRKKKEEVNEVAQVYHEPHVAKTFAKSRISQKHRNS